MEAQPSRNIPGARPSPNTPSDVSCSSGPCSAVSTRETSPASSTHHLLEACPARDPLTSCPDDTAAIPSTGPDQLRPLHNSCRPRPGLDNTIPSPLEMDPGFFQPVSAGRRSSNRLAAERPRPSHTSSGATPDGSSLGHCLSGHQFRQALAPAPPQHPQSIPPASTSIPRGLRTPTWRSSTVSLDSLTSPSPICSNLTDHHPPAVVVPPPPSCPPRDTPTTRDFPPTASSPPFLRQGVSSFDPRGNNGLLLAHHHAYHPVAAGFSFSTTSSKQQPPSTSSTQYHRDRHPFETHTVPVDNLPFKMKPQTGKIIADSALDRNMAYCYDRGGGEFTRLVPVDMLPAELENIPRRVPTDAEMIVLPMPRQPGADGQPADAQMEQQRFATPTSSPIGNGNGNGNGMASTDIIQSQIDSIINASPVPGGGQLVLATRGFDGKSTPTRRQGGSSSAGGSSGRREKVYCDKWIHDGTCAFTQQGCKFKHEMPHDRETQEKLGLFHGYPTWWKKAAMDLQRPLAIDDRPVSLNSGRAMFPALTASTSMGSGLSNAVVSSNWRTGPGPVGGGDAGGVNRSPSSPTPMGSGGGSGGGGVGRSIGFGGAGRGAGRQVRIFASFTPPTYGPIGPPSRAGGASTATASSSGPASGSASGSASGPGLGSFAAVAGRVPTTRNTRSMTLSSLASNNTTTHNRSGGDRGGGGGGAPYNGTQRSAFESGNPFAALGELVQHSSPATSSASHAEDPEGSSSGDNTAATGEQRGAPL
ncbi:hypothetical protein KVR01_011618 [Diaporthe batatas]|uniref:uncharacterized protein n=1 Tax=Diaporthe batatas TaxID=748121 RepID=UPI001D049C3A|nr:uncharacterized protein KVR01_011618 [Diaporthe batatas]KAG8158496.1 hypothetical protein KVR01_011618 [Diaporthe batatas]